MAHRIPLRQSVHGCICRPYLRGHQGYGLRGSRCFGDESLIVFLGEDDERQYLYPPEFHRDYEKAQATIRLMNEIAKGRRSGETEGYISAEDMRAHFCARANEKQDKLHG